MLVAIVLSIAILIGFQYFFEKPTPPVANAPAPREGVSKEQAKPEAEKAPSSPVLAIPKTQTEAAERTVIVENDLYRALFTSKGGTVKSLELKQYKDKNGKPIVLKSEQILPALSLGVDDTFQFSQVNFTLRSSDVKLSPTLRKGTLVFEYATEGYSVRRTYTFSNDDYGFMLKDELGGVPSYWITLGKDFGIHEKDSSVHFGPVLLKDADREEFEGPKLKETKIFKEGVKWIAEEDKYFFSAIVPKSKIQEAKVWAKNGDGLAALQVNGSAGEYFVYVGPKEYDQLKKFGAGLEHIIDFGWFSFLAVPLFWFLKFLNGLAHNYGVAIIILTVLVRIPFIPIVNKGQKSMKRLQDLQPKMAEIREQYKKDPQRMQKELMGLYKKHKVNPMGGCLPMVLQIPVFFALYKVLLIAIELRGAPFALWVQDLSAKDPYYILPIVMGVTMVIQQKMTPSTMDPKQQKLMMLMPVVFTFMFLSFPSGLVLYWLANNVLSIAQQLYVNKKAQKATA